MAPAVQKTGLVLISNELFDFIVLGYKNTGVKKWYLMLLSVVLLMISVCNMVVASVWVQPFHSYLLWFGLPLLRDPGLLLQSTYTDISVFFFFRQQQTVCAASGQLFYFLLFVIPFSVAYFFPLVLFLFL